MKTFRVLSISGQKRTLARLEKAGINTPGIAFSHANTYVKAIDLLESLEVSLIIICDDFKQKETLAFLEALQKKFRMREMHIWIYSINQRLANACNKIYAAGVIDFISPKTETSILKTRFEVYRRLNINRNRIRELLENILPHSVVEELEVRGKYPPRRHGLVTVLFTDFVRFTEKSEKIEPIELVRQLDSYYKEFDKIIVKYKLEKIKTIGDSYMCAGGVPNRNGFNPVSTVLAALEINQYLLNTARQNKYYNKPIWKARIGLNTGDLVSGIVGDLKYSYDIWGETVNVAARMESSGEAGHVNISEITYNYIKEYFNCTYRGEIEAKYMGKVKMYYVDSIKNEYSVDGNGKTANEAFLRLAGIIKIDFDGAKNFILGRLRNELDNKMYYHSVHHTIDVMRAVEEIGIGENISKDDMILLKTAAAFHDAGYLEVYSKNEENAVRMVRKLLPKYGYSASQIKIICEIIRSTKQRAKPTSLLQKIMNDADYDYLGRKDYTEIANRLGKELALMDKTFEKGKWARLQLYFLEKQSYYTKTASNLRDKQKIKNLKALRHSLKKK